MPVPGNLGGMGQQLAVLPLSRAGRGWLCDPSSVAPQQDSLEAEGQSAEGEDGAREGSMDSRVGCRGPSVNIRNSL